MKKKNVCQLKNCNVIIKLTWSFCVMHWSMLSPDVQDEFGDVYIAGQSENYKLKTKKWYRLIVKARYLIEENEE